jgi:V8-like Glu-specific endopeptidase
MLSAKPYPMPAVEKVPDTQEAVLEEAAPEQAGFVTGSKDGAQPKSFLLSADDSAIAAMSGAGDRQLMVNNYDYPPPHTTFYVPSTWYGTYPHKTVGRVFFSSGGYNYSCSGSSIGGRAVITAGHCVSDGASHWHTNWTFTPAYKSGAAPYGVWSAFYLTTFAAWHTGEELGRDVGFAAVSDKNALKLSQTVGYLGFAYGGSRVRHWNTFGYPAGSPYNGASMVNTEASYSKTDTAPNPDTTGIGTNQTGGCSGGPWIYTYKPATTGACNYANGVNSYVYISPAEPYRIYSPYFDTSVNSLRLTAIGK